MTTISVAPEAVVTAVAAVPKPDDVTDEKNDSVVVGGLSSASCSVKELESRSDCRNSRMLVESIEHRAPSGLNINIMIKCFFHLVHIESIVYYQYLGIRAG